MAEKVRDEKLENLSLDNLLVLSNSYTADNYYCGIGYTQNQPYLMCQ